MVAIAVAVTLIVAAAAFVVSPNYLQGSITTTTTAGSDSVHLTNESGQTSSSTIEINSTSSSTIGKASTPYCLLLIPADAKWSPIWNFTFVGSWVTYSNGTQAYFSSYSCPQPVYGNKTAQAYNGVNLDYNLYALATASESNSTFIAAENGSQFLFQTTSGIDCDTANFTCKMELFFYQYGDSTMSLGCTVVRNPIAGIMATYSAVGGYDGPNGSFAWATGGFDLHNIQTMTADQISTYYEESFPCG